MSCVTVRRLTASLLIVGMTGSAGSVMAQSLGAAIRQGTTIIDAEENRVRRRLDAEQAPAGAELRPDGPVPEASVGETAPLPEADVRFMLNRVTFDPSRILTEAELSAITSDYAGRNVSFADLNRMIERLNALYDEKSRYIGRAVIEPQEIDGGVLKVSLIEASVEDVAVTNDDRLQPGFIEAQLGIMPGELVDLEKFKERIIVVTRRQGLSLTPFLTPGDARGGSVLGLGVAPRPFVSFVAGADNYGADSVGRSRAHGALTFDNLIGTADALTLATSLSEGAQSVSLSFDSAVGSTDDRLNAYIAYAETEAVSGVGESVGTTGELLFWSLGYDHALYDDLNDTLTLRFGYGGSDSDSDIGAITRDQNRHIFRAEVDYVHYLDRGAVSARLGGGASHYEETFTDPITGAEKISGWNPRMYAGVAASYRPFTAFPRTSVGFSLNAETALRDNPVGGYNYYLGGLHTLAAYEDSYFAGDSGYNTAIEVKGYLPEEVVAEGMDVELGAFFQHGGVFEGMLFDPASSKRQNFANSIGVEGGIMFDNHVSFNAQAAWAVDGVHRRSPGVDDFRISLGASVAF